MTDRDYVALEVAEREEPAFQEAPPPGEPIDAGRPRARAAIKAIPFVWRDPALIPPRQWLYGSHLIRKFVSTTVAPGGIGKSALSTVEMLSMTTGRDLLGVGHAGEPLRVWLWNLEDPLDELERRLVAARLHYGIDPEEIGDRLFVNSGRDQELIVARTLKDNVVVAQPVVDALIAEMRAKRVDVLIVDPFVSCHSVKENDNGAIDRVAKTFAAIADRTNAAVELIHHVRKTNGAEVTIEDGRGAIALMAAARSARALNGMSKEEAEKAGVENPRAYFRVDNGKASMAPPPDKSAWRKFTSVDLGNGDSVGVVEPWKWPDAFEGVKAGDLLRVQQEIAQGRWREDLRANDWAGVAIGRALKLGPTDKRDRARIVAMLKRWIATGALKTVKGMDEKRRERSYVEVGQWADE